jgi:hypothetical protein
MKLKLYNNNDNNNKNNNNNKNEKIWKEINIKKRRKLKIYYRNWRKKN